MKESDGTEPPADADVPQAATAARPEPEIFSTFIPEDGEGFAEKNGSDLERQIFSAGVRLLGLVLIFLAIYGIPDLASVVFASIAGGDGRESSFASLLFPFARILFFLISGVYLIAGGRLLIKLLPR